MEPRGAASELDEVSFPTGADAVAPEPSRTPLLEKITGSRSGQAGLLLMLGSCALLALGDTIAKWLSAAYPVGEIIFIRGLVIIVLLLVISGKRAISEIQPRHPLAQAWRAFLFVAATFLTIWSLKLLPLPMVSAIGFTSPLIVMALAPSLLGEAVGLQRWIATSVGFAGVLLIVNPLGAEWQWYLLLPLCAACASALRDIATRQIASRESGVSVVFIAVAATLIGAAFTIPFGWVVPAMGDTVLFLAIGLAHGTAYLMQVRAFRLSEAQLLMPFKYSLLLWSIVFAFAVWGYLPTLSMLLGAAIVMGSGLYVWAHERNTRRRGQYQASRPPTCDGTSRARPLAWILQPARNEERD
jgi:drug/metabolite transporter (DMT)-like permease